MQAWRSAGRRKEELQVLSRCWWHGRAIHCLYLYKNLLNSEGFVGLFYAAIVQEKENFLFAPMDLPEILYILDHMKCLMLIASFRCGSKHSMHGCS